MAKTPKMLDMRGIAQRLSQFADGVFRRPSDMIDGIDPDNFPTASQPVGQIGPPGSLPLTWPFNYGQNLIFTPRNDSVYTAAELRELATYPLARMCIDNAKDIIGQIPWSIELKQMAGEGKREVEARRRRDTKGDDIISKISSIFELPDGHHDWDEWLRNILEDMLTIDAASILIQRSVSDEVIGFEWTPGDPITRYIDDVGRTPAPPSPAYAQLWQGMPRVDLTTDQLMYRPRNIVPRGNMMSSYLYGYSPTESIATEIKVGQNRLAYVLAYYDQGAISNMIHVVPPKVSKDQLKEAMQWVNSELAGNLGSRRQYRIIQGFQEDGKPDQIIEPKEPVLADLFDDLLIRKFCYVYGNSPQRLMKQMNRGSAQVSQSASQEEGIKPWVEWVRARVNFLIQRKMGYLDYELVFSPFFEADYTKKSKADNEYVKEGVLSRNEVREGLGKDPSKNPMADELTITTANGCVKLGEVIVSGKNNPDGGAPTPSGGDKPKPTAKYVNGAALIERGM